MDGDGNVAEGPFLSACLPCLPFCLQGVFVDGEGNVAEGPNMNIACLLVSE